MGLFDAAECPVTFGSDRRRVQVIAPRIICLEFNACIKAGGGTFIAHSRSSVLKLSKGCPVP